MKWILINNKHSVLQEFHLIGDDACKVVMKYNPGHRSVRISCEDRHRLFFIESTGSVAGKYIFKNEYGMEIGNMNHEKWFGKGGSVIVETSKYTYIVKDNLSTEFIIYEGMSQQKLVSCELMADDTGETISRAAAFGFTKCLLLGLCWYLSVAITKQGRIEFAA